MTTGLTALETSEELSDEFLAIARRYAILARLSASAAKERPQPDAGRETR